MIKALLPTLLLLAVAIASPSAASEGISYRMLWHLYQLSRLSTDSADALTVSSKTDAPLHEITFSPQTTTGQPLMRCEPSGLCILEWDPQRYHSDARITHDQPPGSLIIEANWSFDKPGDTPWLLFLAANLDRLVNSWRHYAALQGLAKSPQPSSPHARDSQFHRNP